MITKTKWTTPWQTFPPYVVEKTREIYANVLKDIESGKWNRSSVAKNDLGYVCGLGPEATSFNMFGLILVHFTEESSVPYADAVFELIVSILGSETYKMSYPSPRYVELLEGKLGVIGLINRCINTCDGIEIDRKSQNLQIDYGEEANSEDSDNERGGGTS
ncbi:hypothetical protein [Neptunomonas sp.]|uniref:hypothetical protein n=1 Tax=Neptunomonas sp. TaxID=1971898 RepID=UPI003562124F